MSETCGPDPTPVVMEGVTYSYAPGEAVPQVLEDVTLSIERNDFLGLIGPNGGGKSTLLKILLGLLRPQSGRVRVFGREPREVSRQIGYVPQHAQIDLRAPARVLDVVLMGRLGLSPWGFRYGKTDIAAARSAMAAVGVADFERRRLGELSGGQRQRVLIARALASEARILLLDEPMAGVDLEMERGVLETLKQLNERLPIVLVSHDVGFISAFVKRVACLNCRLTVHAADQVSEKTMADLYGAVDPMRPLHHHDHCPIERKTGVGGTGH